jgi:hypothetical protein
MRARGAPLIGRATADAAQDFVFLAVKSSEWFYFRSQITGSRAGLALPGQAAPLRIVVIHERSHFGESLNHHVIRKESRPSRM